MSDNSTPRADDIQGVREHIRKQAALLAQIARATSTRLVILREECVARGRPTADLDAAAEAARRNAEGIHALFLIAASVELPMSEMHLTASAVDEAVEMQVKALALFGGTSATGEGS